MFCGQCLRLECHEVFYHTLNENKKQQSSRLLIERHVRILTEKPPLSRELLLSPVGKYSIITRLT